MIEDDGAIDVEAKVNWIQPFEGTGDKLTGDPVIFDSVVYWPTFQPAGDVCDFGRGRLWAGSFVNPYNPANVYQGPDPMVDLRLDEDPDADVVASLGNNSVIYGVEIALRPSCVNIDTDGGAYDYSGSASQEPQLIVQTGSMDIDPDSSVVTTSSEEPTGELAQKLRIDIPSPEVGLQTLSWAMVDY